MGFFDLLARGVEGVTLALRDGLRPVQDFGESALAMDPEGEVGLHAAFSPYRMVLDPRHDGLLKRDAERCARDLFDDPQGSPLVSLEVIEVSGRHAVEAIHRMKDLLVLGHLLIPTPGGCVELRPLSQDADDPVGRVRALLAWIRANVRISGALPPANGASVRLPELGCVVTPPPRFGLHRDGNELAQFSRLSLATTDGVALLTLIRRGPRRDVSVKALQQIGEQIAASTVPEHAHGVKMDAVEIVSPEGREDVEVGVTFQQTQLPPRQKVFRVFVHDGEVWVAGLSGPQSTPRDEASEELASVVASIRPV